jgi:CelD/BcsL family acetyltransferase involved in cellulose biosynthesis
MQLNQMPEESQNTRDSMAFAASSGWLLGVQTSPSPLRRLPESYDDLLRSMPSRFRTSLRSSRRRLLDAHDVQFGLHETRQELPEALAVLFRNHASRWETKGQQGVFVDRRKRDFYEELSSRLLASGALRFFFLRLDGKIVAQQFCFEHRGTVYLLQEGFDPAFHRANVGNVLRAMVFEHLIAQGARAYDFLAGVSRHKRNWSDQEPNDLRIEFGRDSAKGRIAFQLPRYISALAKRARAIAGRGSTRPQKEEVSEE